MDLSENIFGSAVLPPRTVMLFGRQENLWVLPEEYTVKGDTSAYRIAAYGDHEYGVITSGVGSAQVALTVETAVHAGVRRIVGLGFLGSITPSLKAGDVLVAEGAVRLEGASHSFLPRWVLFNRSVTSSISHSR
ncbi:MAG: hypothetical protein KIT09_35680 [Bryobacteraceae bacterium]|nr:hypothetical protein [Bryobacteraceae bacterium]